MSSIITNYAFIDSQNLNLNVQKLGWKLSYKKFRIYLKEKYHIEKAFMFIGFVEGNQKLYENLREAGFIVKFKRTIADKQGRVKGNVDVEIVLSVMLELKNYNKAIIVSSDGDFSSLVEHLYTEDKLEGVISPDKNSCSTLLQKSAKGRMFYVDDLRDKLEYIKSTA